MITARHVVAFGISAWLGCGATQTPTTTSTRVPSTHAPTRTELYRSTAAALVRIESPDRAGLGFVVRADGIVVTTYAVLVGAHRGRVVLADGRALEIQRVLAADEASDVALIAIDAHDLDALATLADTPPAIGTRLLVVGQGLGMSAPTLVEATVGAEPNEPGNGLWISGPMLAGFGGAPVIDAHGRVAGMVGAGPVDGLNHALGADALARMLAALRPAAGETIAAFGERTDALEHVPGIPRFEPALLVHCSTHSREATWVELGIAEELAIPVYEAGAHEAAFRVLESASLRLARELPDCRELVDALMTAVAVARTRDTPSAGTDALAGAYDDALELLFSVPGATGRLSRAQPVRPSQLAPGWRR